ncbi:MAG: D-glycero-beta-D-manno-heptose-7-phosphate kinase [Mitsuaria chitosanitabida]|uniref:D-glycero-beta-D-manno-heptose-7-phosphate kinase n=1 Tax=Roseateles chitosanitabidus TaxID=65048 RepID=UPI001AFF285E|nr:D-glycero-beta-D-manno-heptose-7-phosphate kinase [Roseateles chitosanitabidus]MBO9689966.1 D-glycero-beta-D-manno-heptose-7-phosphate kinase [Roseateles chitosanitabidus]
MNAAGAAWTVGPGAVTGSGTGVRPAETIGEDLLPESAPPTVLIVGDCMLDVYLEGAVHRISPEAPVPILRLRTQSQRAGGAANVALNLARLRCPCTLSGLVGTDTAGACLIALLDQPGITQRFVRSPAIDTTQKIRMVSQRQQLLRMDVESEPPRDCVAELNAVAGELSARHRWVLLSDYAKGALSDVQPLLAACRAQGCRVLVDPKRKDLEAYRGAWLLKPNLAELREAVGEWRDEEELCERLAALQARLDIDHVLLTRGEQGMSLYSREGGCLHMPTQAREVYDVSGAGDTVLAALTCFLARGASLEDAVHAANRAAGLVVGKFGTASVTLEELGVPA